MDIANLQKGAIIGNDLAIVKKLGEGYTGIVYQALDESRREQVAIKFLKKTDQKYDAITERFKGEFQKQLIGKNHENIGKVYRFGHFEGFFYFESELIAGPNIYTGTRGLSIEDRLKYLIKILEGLDFIHRSGLLHLDIKAENVFLKGEKERVVKIVDFGVAVFASDDIHIAGTPHYIAPEVVMGQKDKIDARADLYSWAVLAYYCLTNGFPFHKRWGAETLQMAAEIIKAEKPAKPLTSLIRNLPEYLNTIILRLLEKDPKNRFYPNARAVVNALLTHQPEAFGSSAISASYLRPIGDEHIGRHELQDKLNTSLEMLCNGKQPSESIFYIKGSIGLGKTHILTKLGEKASLEAENVDVHYLAFPSDELAIEHWTANLHRVISENKRGVLICADDVHERKNAEAMLNGIVNLALDRIAKPELYENIKPILLILTVDEETTIAEELEPLFKDDDPRIITYELKPFSTKEMEEYLKRTPALANKNIPAKWLEHFFWTASGIPSEVIAQLNELDMNGGLFSSLDGEIIVPAVEEPSLNITSWHGAPMATKDRLVKQYNKLTVLEKEVVNFIAVWSHKKITREATEDDISNFFYSPSIKQIINNLSEKGIFKFIISKGEALSISRQLSFCNPYLQSIIYELLPIEDRHAIHDSIVGYLKDDEDGILLHRGYGTFDGGGNIISLIKLSRKRVQEQGDITLAIGLLNDVLTFGVTNVCLRSFLHSLLINYHSTKGAHDRAIQLFSESDSLNASDMWKTQFYKNVIPSYIYQQKFTEAGQAIEAALKSIKYKNSPVAITIKNCSGRIFYEQYFRQDKGSKLIEEAKVVFEETLKAEETLFVENRNNIQNNELGYILLVLGQYEKAIILLKEKLERHKRKKNLFGEITTSIVIANACQLLKDYKVAEEFANYALKLAKITRQGKWVLVSHQILANVYHDAGRIDDSISECNRCFAIGPLLENVQDWELIRNQLWVTMGHLFKDRNDFEKAILYFDTAIQMRVTGHYKALAHLALAEIYSETSVSEKIEMNISIAEEVIKDLPKSSLPFCEPRLNELKKQALKKLSNKN